MGAKEETSVTMEYIRSSANSYTISAKEEVKCPECSNAMVASEGCFTCPKCGYSKCD